MPETPFRLGIPPSVGLAARDTRLIELERVLSASLESTVIAVLATSYQDLARGTQLGDVDAAWAPPFVAARLETLGLSVLIRGVRQGSSLYRSALVAREAGPGVAWLRGKRAVWVDQDSVSGYLLPLSFLKGQGFVPKDFAAQSFAGSFVSAAEKVLANGADYTAVFAAPEGVRWQGATALDELAPLLAPKLHVVAYTEAVPSSGLVIGPRSDALKVAKLRTGLEALQRQLKGMQLLESLFHIDGFEPAPKMGYRALYRLAITSL
jgi:phosphonate transport system substrate-binding protein